MRFESGRPLGRGASAQFAGAFAAGAGFLSTGLIWDLADPPVLHPSQFMIWWSSRAPVVAAMSLLRLSGLLCAAYWMLLCAAVILASRSKHLLRLARLRLPGLRRLVRLAGGTSLLGVAAVLGGSCASGASPTSAVPSRESPVPPVLVPLAGPRPLATGTNPPTAATSPTPVASPTPATPTTTPVLATTVTTWTVRPGDGLWSISESALAERLGRPPTQTEIAALWLDVIEANRASLPDPSNPNLIFAGEVVQLPG